MVRGDTGAMRARRPESDARVHPPFRNFLRSQHRRAVARWSTREDGDGTTERGSHGFHVAEQSCGESP